MPKTVQINGSTLLPAYCNAINGIDGNTGIILDGADTDGHGPKLDLANHVTGILELANKGPLLQNLQTEASINNGASYTVPVNFDIMRNGTTLTLRVINSPALVLSVSGQPIRLRPLGGGSWDSNFFGTQQSISCAFSYSSLLALDKGALMMRHTNNASDLEIFGANFTNFTSGDDITLSIGTSIVFTLAISDF